MQELKEKLYDLIDENILKIILSNRRHNDGKYIKTVFRPILLKNILYYQAEHFTEKQTFHENVPLDDLFNIVYNLILTQYRQGEIQNQNHIYSIKITKKNKLLFNKKSLSSPKNIVTEHNRQKQYIFNEGEGIPILKDLGIFSSNGEIIKSKYDKFKQINRFIEMIDDIVSKDKRQFYEIIDFGCGKSYLTFVLYHYMTKIAKKDVNITGLDLKKDVIEKCSKLAEKYNYTSLKFLQGDIKDYKPARPPCLVISLHACDIATDFAINTAYSWQADYILCVPCCQHEVNKTIDVKKSSAENTLKAIGILTDYGLIKERFSSLITDALRGKLLEYCGYDVDILEFIDISHSPKNILIRAKKRKPYPFIKRNLILQQISELKNQLSFKHTLFELLVKQKTFKINDKCFSLFSGRASLLLSDAAYVREEVFIKEQKIPLIYEFDCYDTIDR